MKDIQNYLKQYLMRLSLDPTHKGYEQLYDCVLTRISNEATITDIYSAVAVKYGIQSKSVMRNISYALNKVDKLSERLSEIMGIKIDNNSLHNGNIIFYLADIVSNPEMYKISV